MIDDCFLFEEKLMINDCFLFEEKIMFCSRIIRFLCFCEIHRFQNLQHHHRHWYIKDVPLMLISFEP